MKCVKMESTMSQNKPMIQPKTMAELLPGLGGILTKEAMQTLTARKAPRPTLAVTRTTEKNLRPLTLAEMRSDIQALRVKSPQRPQQPDASTKKKGWNSSIKLDKKISRINEGKINTVRKTLVFQSKPKITTTSNPRTLNSQTPKFPKPEFRPEKALQAKNNVRISGICNIPPTPVDSVKPNRSRFTVANKENTPKQRSTVINPGLSAPVYHKRFVIPYKVPDTPMSNDSLKSSGDASFLLREKEIYDIEDKKKALEEEPTLENIAEVSPPISTPFKEYRSVQDYFNNTSDMENSAAYLDNTIMLFHKNSNSQDNLKREESVIVSLCDLLNKASVTNTETNDKEFNDLLEVQRQTEQNIKMIDSGIQMLQNIKEAQIKSLLHVRKLIQESKERKVSENENDKTLVDANTQFVTEEPKPSGTCSVIKKITPVKSPSYKIPRRNMHLRKSIYKSMPNVNQGSQTPNKDTSNKAMSMYMKMKQQMNFLNTPVVKQNVEAPDTPALTSHNLQRQLSKLYDGSQ